MTSLDDQNLDVAYAKIEELRGILPDEQINEMYRRLGASPDEVRDEARDEARAELEPEYELDGVDGYDPEFYEDSDQTADFQLGKTSKLHQVPVRYLNVADLEEMAEYVRDAWQYMSKRGSKSLQKVGFGGFMSALASIGLRDMKRKKPTMFAIAIYRAVAKCLSNPDPDVKRIITIKWLRSFPASQIVRAIKRIFEVNQEHFFDLWAETPGPIRNTISSVIGRISQLTSQVGSLDSNLAQLIDGFGGILNGGLTNSPIPSLPSTAGTETASEASPSSKPGDTKNPSKPAARRKVTSPG